MRPTRVNAPKLLARYRADGSALRSVLCSATLSLSLVASLACHEPPPVGRAAAPERAEGHTSIMGGATNVELNAKVAILKALLDGKLTRNDLQKRIEKDFAHMSAEEKDKKLKILKEALGDLPPTVGAGKPMADGPDRSMILARFYFAERRFIESSEHLTAVLDAAPAYNEARNLLARCFFFLGNPDRTIQELEVRMRQIEAKQKAGTMDEGDSMEYVDALFLIGAAVAETPGTSKQNLEKGKLAWEGYLKLAPESPSRERVLQGLEEIKQGLRGEGRLAQGPMRKAAQAGMGAQGVKGGSASFAGGPAAKSADRVKNLPKDASPFDRAVAAGLDALDMRDIAKAQTALEEASKIKPGDPLVETGIARIWVQTGKVPEAMRKYGEIIKRNPDFMPAWHYYGMAHLMNNDPGQAAKSWEHIQKTNPDYFTKHNLARRVQIAKRMAQGG